MPKEATAKYLILRGRVEQDGQIFKAGETITLPVGIIDRFPVNTLAPVPEEVTFSEDETVADEPAEGRKQKTRK